jgi:signal peptide peptidase SppA
MITPQMLSLIVEVVSMRAAGVALSEAEIDERLEIAAAQNGPRQGAQRLGKGMPAVIPIYGPITARANMLTRSSGGTTLEALTTQFRDAMRDGDANSVVFDIDSPGGTVEGVDEFAAEVRRSRGEKPIVASANLFAGSAAYYIASAADEIVASRTALVGSIGVLAAHEDWSKAAELRGVKTTLIPSTGAEFKIEGNRHEPLTDEAREMIQKQIDEYHGMFVSAVARGRGISVDKVRSDFGHGRMLMAKDALAAGMIDRIETFDATLSRLARGGSRARPLAAPEPAEEIELGITTEPLTTGLATDLPFAERLRLVTAEAAALADIARERAARRAQDGRTLSREARDGLDDLRKALLATASDLELEADETPQSAESPVVGRDRARLVTLLEAATAGGYRLP